MNYIYATKIAVPLNSVDDVLNTYANKGWRLHTAIKDGNFSMMLIFEMKINEENMILS